MKKNDNLNNLILVLEFIKIICLILIASFIILVVLKIVNLIDSIEGPIKDELNNISKLISQFGI